jgi:hypothetical protein
MATMTRDMIVQIWEAEGAKLAGQNITIRDEREATCFVATHGEVMSVGKVIKLELRETFVTLLTGKDERFVFAYADILGFKLSSPSAPNKDRGAGFAR